MAKQKTCSRLLVLPSGHNETPDFERQKVIPATIGLAEAALILGIHKSTAHALYQAGEFPVPIIRVRTRIRVVKVHILQFLETDESATFGTTTAKPVAFEPIS
jgi:hypothetical protein